MGGQECPALPRPRKLLAHRLGSLCRSLLALHQGGLCSGGMMATMKAGAGACEEAVKHPQPAPSAHPRPQARVFKHGLR